MSETKINPNEHVFAAGQTQSGKTWLVKKYLPAFKNVVALDTKGLISWPEIPKTKWKGTKKNILVDGGKELTLVTRLADLANVSTPKIIYRPRVDEMNEDYYEAFFKWCYYRKNCIVWVDEAMSVCPNASRIPFHYRAILTRGMERDTAVWSLTQRPTGIPPVILSEATHFFVFRLHMPQDREKIADITGCPEFMERPDIIKENGRTIHDPHVFWYWWNGWDQAVRAKLEERRP